MRGLTLVGWRGLEIGGEGGVSGFAAANKLIIIIVQ